MGTSKLGMEFDEKLRAQASVGRNSRFIAHLLHGQGWLFSGLSLLSSSDVKTASGGGGRINAASGKESVTLYPAFERV